jgi:hypothetical protein
LPNCKFQVCAFEARAKPNWFTSAQIEFPKIFLRQKNEKIRFENTPQMHAMFFIDAGLSRKVLITQKNCNPCEGAREV